MKKNFAIIGNPIAHSLSPILHNYWFKKYNINAEYSLLNIDEKDLDRVTKDIRSKKLSGINITLPYKQKIIPFVDQLINDAKSTNSVNTVFLDENDTLIGENTDVYGLQAAYFKELVDIEKKKALVIGAGGVSQSVIFSLQKTKVKHISLINRTYEKSIFMKKNFKLLNILEWNSLKDEINKFDIIINATSLGLKNGNDFNVKFDKVKDSLIYIDTIYNPPETKTIRFLKNKGVKTFNGLDMFIYQGQKSFYLWNKINPEIDDKLLELLQSNLR